MRFVFNGDALGVEEVVRQNQFRYLFPFQMLAGLEEGNDWSIRILQFRSFFLHSITTPDSWCTYRNSPSLMQLIRKTITCKRHLVLEVISQHLVLDYKLDSGIVHIGIVELFVT
ncbi:hypothetical protein QVD17_08933 [Tagetes erecta]|uniref:Uncharacterized protein n=1 Tax=Tagetes erecta TaxID=13708 RepID=A0AAD8KYF5_TARER|nr:hypothetical protein QVD17_08933 [Tagetes erecta]